jgi:hypothetical protein
MQDSRKWLEKKAWESVDRPEMVSFHTDGGDSWSVLFARLGSVHYIAAAAQVVVDCELGTFFITGPKALEFYDEFTDHRASKVKRDGDGITSVTLVLADEERTFISSFSSVVPGSC